ncbi:MAG: hypothetical protein RLZ04_2099 [Actinomycetota bacterium]|jgi:drug/metabolite transporter (DMT)-like permease
MALGAGVVWSLGTLSARSADGADAFQYLIWRSVGIIVVIELLSLRGTRRFPTIRAWQSGWPMAFANFGIFLASITFVYAVKTTTPANAAFLGSLTPLVAVVFSRFLGERLSRSTIIALAVAFAGLVVTVFSDLEAGSMVGNIAALMSSVGFSIYTVMLRTDTERDWSPAMSGYGLLMIVVCAIVTIASGKTLVPALPDVLLALLHGAVFIVVGTLMFNHASRQLDAVPMAVFAQTEMVFTPIWASLFLGLTPKPLTIVGGAIIFAAVVGKALYDTGDRRQTVPSGSLGG